MVKPYSHEPATDFSIVDNKNAFEMSLRYVENNLGKEFPLVIGGEKIFTDEKLVSINPAQKDQVIGFVSKATPFHIDKAMKEAQKAFETWKTWEPRARAELLLSASAIIRRRKHEFSALMVYESGKPWNEADGDTNEAIEFIEYYARSMMELAEGKPVLSRKGEHNKYMYMPMGPGVTISPWNFPFAIATGTTVAPIVAGNTVLLKPAESTPLIAYKLIEVLEEAGLPKGVVNFVPGDPLEIGDYLVDHPQAHFITFTGSRDTGARIYNRASVVQEGQTFLKRTIAEMGGKDTIIVDDSADVELAANAIVNSAFGFSGQKCSACSRAIVHKDIYDQVLNRSIELTKELRVGDPVNYKTYIGPIINQKQFDKINKYIDIGKGEGELKIGGNTDNSVGYFVEPTIFSNLDPEARIMQEEIFGPVLAFTKANNFEEMIQIANNTEYGLTGSVITRNRIHWEQARVEFNVGNLYLNRGCTAAIVGYQPFGGFKMSGTNAKTGSPDYLLNFLEQKAVSEMF